MLLIFFTFVLRLNVGVFVVVLVKKQKEKEARGLKKLYLTWSIMSGTSDEPHRSC